MRPYLAATLLCCALSYPSFSLAQDETQPEDPAITKAMLEAEDDERGTLSITYENDIFSGRDDGYTNGFRASWTTGADKVPFALRPFANAIPFFPDDGQKRISYALGQSMFTPNDIEAYSLQPNDRPYAGWLYGTVGLVSDTGTQYDTLELTLGMVGPASLAHPTQRLVHQHITGSPEPRGWTHQLDNEPGIVLSYDRKWRSFYQFSALGHGVDFTPGVGAAIGNVMTDAKMGATIRIGRNLPSDYGPPRVRPALSGSDYFIPTRGLGWYLFAGAEGRYVARNIFLDGNTFSDSHSVDKENWVGDIQTGIAVTYNNWRVAYTHIFRSKEYDTQSEAESFGAFTVSTQF
jgi:lipid A 3-O-deacylase